MNAPSTFNTAAAMDPLSSPSSSSSSSPPLKQRGVQPTQSGLSGLRYVVLDSAPFHSTLGRPTLEATLTELSKMTKMPGKELADQWKDMEFSAKETLVKEFANFAASLFEKKFSGIGNIYDASSPKPEVGRIVQSHFLWGGHILDNNVPRGPFTCSRDWVRACLAVSRNSHQALSVVDDLYEEVDEVFPPLSLQESAEPEPTVLCHRDLNLRNILVDDNGALTAVLDWECVSAVPLWKACDYPKFLQLDDDEPVEMPDSTDSEYSSDGGLQVSEDYWWDLEEYEIYRLRPVFLAEMAKLSPKWMEVFNSSKIKRDLYSRIIQPNSFDDLELQELD